MREKRSPIKLAKVEGQFWSTLLLSSLVTLLSTNFCFHHVPQSLSYLIIFFAFFFSFRNRQRKRYVKRLLRAPYNLYQISLHLRVTTCEIVFDYSKGFLHSQDFISGPMSSISSHWYYMCAVRTINLVHRIVIFPDPWYEVAENLDLLHIWSLSKVRSNMLFRLDINFWWESWKISNMGDFKCG